MKIRPADVANFADTCRKLEIDHSDGGQGWIRTSVRKTGQIYSLLPLTTRPPVHFLRGVARGKGPVPKKKRPIGETALACQCLKWERAGMNRNFSSLTGLHHVIA
jgi:hypothetical protein